MITLTEHKISAALSAGRRVEQFLKPRREQDETIIRWLDLSMRHASYVITLYEVCDDGGPDYLDVYSFGEAVPDADPAQHSFPSLDSALAFAASTYDAPRNNYVSQGLIQDEYAAYLVKTGRG
jgi:hypothetical protein